jgi:hypothetical protein
MKQLGLDLPMNMSDDVYLYGERTDGETHGVVLTKPHIVDLILDLSDYTSERDLGGLRLLEPACGHGAFLVPAVKRLVESAKREGHDLAKLKNAITAYDIDQVHVDRSRREVAAVLRENGLQTRKARELANCWINRCDFLLTSQAEQFDVVVGNPPYIRIEHMNPVLQAEYRARFASLYDRADLYVAFIEHGLHLLTASGVLSYICADRWVLNRYGAPLRKLITDKYSLRCYVDLHQASPFASDVIAYPAIFSMSPGSGGTVSVAKMKNASEEECSEIRAKLLSTRKSKRNGSVAIYKSWFHGDEPWIISTPEHLEALRSLESRFDPIESFPGTKVGIGVATGNDKVYIVQGGVDIEPDRLVPLSMRGDIENGTIRNSDRFVINTFRDEGGPIDLDEFPRLASYFESHSIAIRQRHVSGKNPRSWFRTIDRVYPELVTKPKLLIPDIAGSNEVVFDPGNFHPHHNFYFVTSDSWDMEVLGGLLSSQVALFFVWSYAVKMRGGYLRFQAQYLRRIRLPSPDTLPKRLTNSIRTAFRKRNFSRLDELALKAYGIEKLPEFDFVDTRR